MPTLVGMGEGEELHDGTKTGPILGGLTPTASFISPGVGFKNHTCLWSSHQNSKERCKVVCCFVLFCLLSLQSYRKVTKACDLLFPAGRASDQLSGTRAPGRCCQVLSDSISIPSLWVPTLCSRSLGSPTPWPAVIQDERPSTVSPVNSQPQTQMLTDASPENMRNCLGLWHPDSVCAEEGSAP